MDTVEATIKVVFGTHDVGEAATQLTEIVSKIEWSCDFIEDVYVEEPPILRE